MNSENIDRFLKNLRILPVPSEYLGIKSSDSAMLISSDAEPESIFRRFSY